MEKKSNKKGSGWAFLIWVLIVVIGVLVNDQRAGSYVRYYLRYLPGIVPLLIALLFIVFVIVLVVKTASRKKEHTHDRTDRVSYDVNETEFEHYKKQLDGFLRAGIIEKEEYRLLLRRYQGK